MAEDYRRADETELLAALRGQQPLALAEVYHRTVPAAHAVARRLMSAATEVESLLLATYAELWTSPPPSGPLEGWVRRTVWAFGSDRLRSTNAAPASPSTATLLPDLPTPEVRFLDAGERAIEALPEEERRALLLAHDKGIPTAEQDPDADQALAQALMALAGPETSSTDRGAMHEDGCDDVTNLGDWTLGLLGGAADQEATEAVDERPGCAARSRTLRRGRRRIEGLPATPDMGHRVLVTVLAGASIPVAPDRDPDVQAALEPDPAEEPGQEVIVARGLGGDAAATDDDVWDDGPDTGDGLDTGATVTIESPSSSLQDLLSDEDPIGDLAASLDDQDDDEEDDPFAALDDEDGEAEEAPPAAVLDTDELSAIPAGEGDADEAAPDASAPETDSGSWAPVPGDTAELRLSDILAGDDGDDDPFAELEADDEPAPDATPAGGPDPYAQLRDIDEPAEALPPAAAMKVPAMAAAGRVGGETLDGAEEVYVEGQEDPDLDGPRRRGGLSAFLLHWLLPILAGGGLGLVAAFLVFGGTS